MDVQTDDIIDDQLNSTVNIDQSEDDKKPFDHSNTAFAVDQSETAKLQDQSEDSNPIIQSEEDKNSFDQSNTAFRTDQSEASINPSDDTVELILNLGGGS